MTDATFYAGNHLPAPGFHKGGKLVQDEILASYTGGTTQDGVTLKPGQGVLKAGTILVQEDGDSKLYVRAANGTLSKAKGLLRHAVDTGLDEDGPVFLGNVLTDAVVVLSAVTDANSGVTVANFPASRANADANTFKF